MTVQWACAKPSLDCSGKTANIAKLPELLRGRPPKSETWRDCSRTLHDSPRNVRLDPVRWPIQFILDDSEKDAPRFYSIWSKAKKYKSFARDRLSSITFSDDRMDHLIQTADLLANAIVNEHPGGSRVGRAGPFRRLFDEPNVPEWEHWDAEMFIKNPDVIADYGTIR
jgi:hypothetical protein